jgi:hypothetical protein
MLVLLQKEQYMDDIAEILLAQIGRTFRVFPDIEELEKLQSLILQYQKKGWRFVLVDKIKRTPRLKIRKFYYPCQRLVDKLYAEGISVYEFLLDHIQELMIESIKNQQFEQAASYCDAEKSLLDIDPSCREQYAREIMHKYPLTLFVAILVWNKKIKIFVKH